MKHRKTTENVLFTTVGKILVELEILEKRHGDESVAVWTHTDLTFGIVGMGLDADGDLRIELEEMDNEEGFYCVADTLDTLKEYDRDVKVYLAGSGLYLNVDGDGSIFAEADEDDENVGFYASVFGQYEEKRTSVWRTDAEERELAENARKEKRESCAETITLAILTVGAAVLLVYKAYCLIARTGGPVWEHILWIVGSIVCLFVGGGILYHHKDNK